jgi:hypothetical protein
MAAIATAADPLKVKPGVCPRLRLSSATLRMLRCPVCRSELALVPGRLDCLNRAVMQ